MRFAIVRGKFFFYSFLKERKDGEKRRNRRLFSCTIPPSTRFPSRIHEKSDACYISPNLLHIKALLNRASKNYNHKVITSTDQNKG